MNTTFLVVCYNISTLGEHVPKSNMLVNVVQPNQFHKGSLAWYPSSSTYNQTYIYWVRNYSSKAAVTVPTTELHGWSCASCEGLILTWYVYLDGVHGAHSDAFIHGSAKR